MKQLDRLLKAVYPKVAIEPFILVRELRMFIGELRTEVGIRIYYQGGKYKYPFFFRTTHFLKTPQEGHPYNSSARQAKSEPEAIRKALRMLTENYESAVANGHAPSESWLHVGDDPF